MNKIIRNSFMAVFAAVALVGCDENDWNEKYLDGFTGGAEYDNTTTAEYTLTTSDYSAITKNTTNTALAEAAGTTSALKAVANNECFSPDITAKEYLPAYMASSSFPYYLANDGSVINITYNQTSGVTDTYTALSGASKYTVTAENYQTAWGSTTDYIEAFAPDASASKKLPAILKAKYPSAKYGDYVIVTYNEATENPVFGTEDEEEKPLDLSTLTSGDVVKFKGQVAAISKQGAVVATEGGNAFIYDKNTTWSNYTSGDQVEVEATVYSYYGALEFTGPTITKTGNAAYTYPTPTTWAASDIATFMDEVTAAKSGSPLPARYIKFTATLKKSGNYYNFYMDGETTKYIGFYQATDAQVANLTDGNTYTITGYAITTGKTYVNLIPTSIDGTSVAGAPLKSRSVVSTPASKSVTAVYTYSGSTWAEASDVAALSASDYTAIGVSNNKLTDAATYLPLFLKNKYPYALAGDQMYVVYNSGTVALLDYDGTNWTLNNDGLATVTTQWKRVNGAWTFVKTVGVATFTIANDATLTLDKKYILVADGICANPLASSYNYGYLYTTAIKTDGITIEMPSDENAFEFVTTYVNGETSITLPEGKFLIKDNSERYLYMSGTYNSFNITATPVVNGELNESAMFTATNNGDGTWTVATTIGSTEKWIQYSTNYGSWGCYSSEQGLRPALYQLNQD